jgi:hypothetical protein
MEVEHADSAHANLQKSPGRWAFLSANFRAGFWSSVDRRPEPCCARSVLTLLQKLSELIHGYARITKNAAHGIGIEPRTKNIQAEVAMAASRGGAPPGEP